MLVKFKANTTIDL